MKNKILIYYEISRYVNIYIHVLTESQTMKKRFRFAKLTDQVLYKT